jgi:hypothetical protein
LTRQETKEKDKGGATGESVCDRVLLCPEEWEDAAGRKVISEFHKEGLSEGAAEVEVDLDSFEQYWREKGAISVRSEYHMEGARYVEEPSERDGYRPRLGEAPDKMTEKETRTTSYSERKAGAMASGNEIGEGGQDRPPPTLEQEAQKQPRRIERAIDTSTLEVITYALFRVAFGKGVRIPIKREGFVDMDITVKGKEVTVNTNQLYFTLPELAVWHIVHTHKGKPVLEFGRGVKKGIKIHRFRALLFVLELWRGSRKKKPMEVGSPMENDETEAQGV